MKIYFAASIWGTPGDQNLCTSLLTHLKQYGTVLSEHLFTAQYKSAEHLDLTAIHDRDLGWVRESDRIVAEVSAPSLGVGYELREGVLLQKPILALWKHQEGKRLSAMIGGCTNIQNATYHTLEEATQHIDRFFS